jgi:hypothetical protein
VTGITVHNVDSNLSFARYDTMESSYQIKLGEHINQKLCLLVIVLGADIGDIIAYGHGLHFCCYVRK